MRLLSFSAIITTAFLTLAGCGDDQVSTPVNVIAGITVDSVLPSSSCSEEDTCYYRVFAHFVEPDRGTHFYRLRLEYEAFKFTGEPFYRSNSSDTGLLVSYTLTVPYYSQLPAQSYFFTIYKFTSLEDAYRMQNYASPTTSTDTVLVYTFSNDCEVNACSNQNLEHARWYARGIKTEDGIIGVQAEIETWLTARMCGQSTPCTTHSVSNVHINVGDTASGYWAQTGIISYRPSGSSYRMHEMFFEVMGVGGRQYRWFTAPNDGDSVHYRLELRPDSGAWYLYIDRHPDHASVLENQGWINVSGNYVSFAAEISHYETDMMGLEGDPCRITDCQYKVGSGYGYVQLDSSNIRTSDISEWGISLGSLGNELLFWDKKPVP